MSRRHDDPTAHPVAVAVRAWSTEAEELADAALWSMSEDATAGLLIEIAALQARVTELEARALAHAEAVELPATTGRGRWVSGTPATAGSRGRGHSSHPTQPQRITV